MKKFFVALLFTIFISFLGYFIFINSKNKINVEDIAGNIDKYYIYGNHLNILGNIELSDTDSNNKFYVCFFNGDEINVNLITEFKNGKLYFEISDKINDGFYLDSLKRGKYNTFLKEEVIDDNKKTYKYYSLSNKTDYDNINYYTISKYNNVININFNNKYNTMFLNVAKNNNDNIYDVTIDPGHGGMDSGAVVNKNIEANYTMETSVELKKYLEEKGLKVKLTHEPNQFSKNEKFNEYNEKGRAVIPNEIKSKYTFSIHYNQNSSSKVNGFEIYTPVNIDYILAENIANNITTNTNLKCSNNRMYKINDCIYSRNFSDYDIKNSLNSYKKDKLNPYNVTKNSNYFYMIRETGGILTGAYIDESNKDSIGYNPYYNSNVSNESYLLEIGYLSNNGDIKEIKTNKNKIVSAIGDAIISNIYD